MQRLRYPEFEELGSAIRRRVATHRRSLSVNVDVRHLNLDLKKFTGFDRFFAVLCDLAAASEFEGARLEIKAEVAAEQKYTLLTPAQLNSWRLPVGTTLNDEGSFVLLYERHNRFVEDMTPDDGYWALTLPLMTASRSLGVITFYRCVSEEIVAVDLQNICGVFQQELAAKLTELLTQREPEAAALVYQTQK
ncbi:MAG: hypothetical protein U0Y68_21130 [Blastocatellia bacterium]